MTTQSRDNVFSVLWYLGLALIIGMMAVALIACVSVPYGRADGLPTKSRVWTPLAESAPETLGWKAHNFYAGVMGSYAWRPDPDKEEQLGPLADEWQLGILAGYLYRSGATGWAAGAEIDWTPHVWDRLRDDDGTLTVRGRAGAFVTSKTFVYGTVGGYLDKDVLTGLVMQGPVVGGGVEQDITANLVLRAEVLHSRYGSDYTDWGSEGDTKLRLGAAVKF
jgi:opacity protein-like surface antigen